jgi:hypothetical protein
MQPHSGHLRKGKDAVRKKAATQEKDVVEDVIDPDLTRATETKIQTPTVTPNQMGKEKAEAKKANRDPDLVPLATESRKIYAAIVAVTILRLSVARGTRSGTLFAFFHTITLTVSGKTFMTF